MTLRVGVKTDSPQKIRLIVRDADLKNTEFTNRWKTVNGEVHFYVRMPITGEKAIVEVFNERMGLSAKISDSSFTVTGIEKMPLEKKMDVVDFSNPMVKSFVKFVQRFCFNAGVLESGTYKSRDGKFTIEYMPVLISKNTGKPVATPARISQNTGTIQVAQGKFVGMTVPMRIVILLHEFSHYYVNDEIRNETEADLNALLIYLGLGYPRIEAFEAFLSVFIASDTEQNKRRYDKINKFIEDFEKNNYIVYE